MPALAVTGPHADLVVTEVGTPLAQAPAAAIVLHGRGGSARDILGLERLDALPAKLVGR